ncbi:MAG: ABC transporter permease [Actinobacteria bacterium]|nr:ABC transporter permease [Actinomycetota bacterium]
MRSIKRGVRSFLRHPLRNLVVLLLLFVCLTFSLSMLAVKLAADSQVGEVKRSVGNYAEVRVSSEYRMAVFEEERSQEESERAARARRMSEEEIQEQKTRFLVPEELADAFSQMDEIVTYDKVLEARITLPDITNTQMETMLSMRERGPQGEAPAALSSSSFTFEGNTDGSSVADFMLGNKELVEGSFYTYQDYLDANPVVMVEETLAEENGIGVGDLIVAEKSGENGRTAEVELTVIGIYRSVEAQEQESGSNTETFNPMGDTFYAPLSVVQELNGTPGYVELGSYYFDSVDSTGKLQEAFETEIADGDKYELATDYSDYESIADPLLKVGKTSLIGLVGALGACALIILLSMAIIVGGRTRELGVLKAIGATDRQVIVQYAAEVLCICLVAIILATGATAMVSQKMGDWLLSGNQPSSQEASAETQVPGGMPGQVAAGPMGMGGDRLYKEGGRFAVVSGQEEAADLEVVYRGSMLLYGILILLAISFLGMLVPLVWITRLRPAQVLSME